MTHISRPLQIALVALLLFVAVWFAVLRGHSSGSESPGSAASSSVQPATPQQPAASSSGSGSSPSAGSTYTGSAPGVAGLSRAIAKARGAVAQSQQNARELQQKSQQASSPGSTQSSKSGAPSAARAKAAPTGAAKTHAAAAAAAALARNGAPVMQAKVEAQLKRGKVVAILIWNPKGTVDATVRRELHAASHKLGGRLAVNVARASEVGSFGNFTHAVRVYSTPTILMVNAKGVTSTVSGLTDAFSIEQAVKEAKRAH